MSEKLWSESLPRILAGLLVPAAQLIWRYVKNQRCGHRKLELRQKISELGRERESLARIPTTPAAQTALNDLDAELSALLEQLAQLNSAKIAPASRPPSRGFMANWLLFYAPTGLAAWAVHVLFFLILSTILFGSIGVAADWNSDPDSPYALISFAVLAVIAAGLRKVARRLDRQRLHRPVPPPPPLGAVAGIAGAGPLPAAAIVRRGRLINWFLLYDPSGPAAWCVHILFFLTVATFVLGAAGIAGDWNTDSSSDHVDGVVGLGIFALAAVGLSALARRIQPKPRHQAIEAPVPRTFAAAAAAAPPIVTSDATDVD